MKFLHAADLHIDSPLKGLEAYEGAPIERLRGATRAAMENLVEMAIHERVDFVLIAGDLFDGEWRDMHTGLWTAGQFRRLAEHQIRVFLLRGNHDAHSRVCSSLRWPENVYVFSHEAAETLTIDELGIAIHGQSFAAQAVPEDLTEHYPKPVEGRFNIGLLHTSLSGESVHDTYAPTTAAVLASRGYDYWALGHIHKTEVVSSETPWIIMPGNTQGRHVNESGEKGCYLVQVEDHQVQSVEFRPVDVLRWHRLSVPVEEEIATVDELIDTIRDRLAELHRQDEHRLTVIRLTLEGQTVLHGPLTGRSGREAFIAELHNAANSLGDVWIERIRIETRPPLDLDQLRDGQDLLGDLIRRVDSLHDGSDESLQQWLDENDLFDPKTCSRMEDADLPLGTPTDLRARLIEARNLLVSRLITHDD
ncbi:MAG: DNA repair exonuclease [Planctomycetia bacterium]|jgi:DNA repair exonuclease SbcCD nuclease subunit